MILDKGGEFFVGIDAVFGLKVLIHGVVKRGVCRVREIVRLSIASDFAREKAVVAIKCLCDDCAIAVVKVYLIIL